MSDGRRAVTRTMRMPSKGELPDGPRRDFVEALRRYYREAGRPALRKISREIEGRDDLMEVTASQETIRRILAGKTLPTSWDRVDAIYRVLCEMADIDPDGPRREDGPNGETRRRHLWRLWDTALEEADVDSGSVQGDALEDPRPSPAAAVGTTEVSEHIVTSRRRAKSVTIIFEHGLIPKDAEVTLQLRGIVNSASAEKVERWLDADPERSKVTWWPDPNRPLRWALEPKREWTPSSLRNEIFIQAGLPEPSFSAADVWCHNDRSLYVIANTVSEGAHDGGLEE